MASTAGNPSSAHVVTRVEELESGLRTELRDLRDQLSNMDTSRATGDVSQYVAKLDQFEKNALKAISDLKKDVELLTLRVREHRQAMMANSLIFNGINENGGSDVYEEVCGMVKNYFGVDVSMRDIDFCHRLGKQSDPAKTRPVVVRFISRWLRDKLYREKRKLKGSKVVISEFLEGPVLEIYKKIRSKLGGKDCWTWNGRIYAIVSGDKKQIKQLSDIN